MWIERGAGVALILGTGGGRLLPKGLALQDLIDTQAIDVPAKSGDVNRRYKM